jgi:hypothetical protein
MPLNKEDLLNQFLSLGFSQGDQVKDLGFSRDYLLYFQRVFEKQHQCLWLTFYDNSFAEAILYVYSKPFNSRSKPAMIPIHAYPYRDLSAVFGAVNYKY